MFSKARILFSVGGKYYNSQPVIYTYMPDTVLERARNVTIHLNHNVGKFVKICLYFANRWIMLSEVNFDSGNALELRFYLMPSNYLIRTYYSLFKL